MQSGTETLPEEKKKPVRKPAKKAGDKIKPAESSANESQNLTAEGKPEASAKAKGKKAESTAKESAQPETRGGVGCLPYEDGTAFRVWAPFAKSVSVIGDFNEWKTENGPMNPEGNGYWYADIKGAKTGQQYSYSILNQRDEVLKRTDPCARQVLSSQGPSIIHNPNFDWGNKVWEMPKWNALVIYQMHIGTFNVKEEGKPGTFESAMEKLSYLKDLGVNMIQLLPPTEFTGDFSWGYNTSLPYAVESAYGGPEAFKQFIKTAHENNMGVLMDAVYNHLGPHEMDIWRFDGWYEGDGGGIYFYNDEARSKTPWGHTRPDYGRPEVRQFLRDNAMMWIDEYRVDGMRIDSSIYIRNFYGAEGGPDNEIPEGWSLMQWLNKDIKASAPWKITIAEDLCSNLAITRPIDAGGAGFDAQWDSNFVYPIRQALTPPDDASRDMEQVATAVRFAYEGDAFRRVVYTESHDEVANGKARLSTEISPDQADDVWSKKRTVLGAGLVFTSPGIPMIFMGQEFLEDGSFHEHNPLKWDKAKEFKGLVYLYRELIAFRRNLKGTTAGLLGQTTVVHHVNNASKVIAYSRSDQGGPRDTTIVVMNFSANDFPSYLIGLPAAGRWKVRFNSDWEGWDESFGDTDSFDFDASEEGRDGLPATGNLTLGPYSMLILSQD